MRILLLIAGLCAGWASTAMAAEICPTRAGQAPRYIDVFDGPSEEMASLVPDRYSSRSATWELGYIYDAGRIVTIRCKYADGQKVDVPLPDKIKRCKYKADAKNAARVFCE